MPDTYRVIVTGDRNWRIDELAIKVVRSLKAKHKGLVIVHGGCKGVDTSFGVACRIEGIPDEPHFANWEGYGSGAGPKRNQEMVDAGARLCLAFHRFLPNSKGTKDCVARAMAAKIPTWVTNAEDAEPVRQVPDQWEAMKARRWGPAIGDKTPGIEVG